MTTSMTKFMADLFESAFSPWFMAFVCGVLTGLTGLLLLSAFGVI